MLSWLGNDAFILDDLVFQIQPANGDSFFPEHLAEGTFSVLKKGSLLEQYVDLLATLQPRNIFEIGIWRGGSTVFLSTLAKPEKLVAVDLVDSSTPSFRDWLQSGPLKDHVVAHFGVDQSDGKALRTIASEEFDGEPLDLVIDDASHILAPTRASFEALFPRLRPGGVYVIEDWQTQHLIEKGLLGREPPETWLELREPLTRLLVQIILASAYTDIIDDIRIRPGSVMIQRGHEDFDQDGFVISDFYLDLGRELLQEDPDRRVARTETDPRPAG